MRFLLAWIVLLNLLFSDRVTACEEPSKKTPCSQAKGGNAADSQSKDGKGFPWVCPLWEVLAMGGGNLYYCERFATSCAEPEVVYAFGVLPFPCDCSEGEDGCCFSGRPTSSFPGLRSPILETDSYLQPPGRAREFSVVSTNSSVPYIKCADGGSNFYAKVFMLSLDVEGAASGFQRQSSRTIWLAFETSHTPSSAPQVNCAAVGSAAPNGTHYVYLATHVLSPTQTIKIMVLRAR